MQVDDNVHSRPDVLPDERGDPVSDSRKRGLYPSSINEGSIQIDPVVRAAFTSSRSERRWVQHRDENDSPQYVLHIDFANEVFQDHWSFVFVPVI